MLAWLLRVPVLGCVGVFNFSVLVAYGRRHGKWRLAGAHHFLVLVQLPPRPGPTRLDSAEEKSPCVETENRLLRKQKTELQESCEEVKRLLKEVHEKSCDPCAEQQQVGCGSGGRLPTCPNINVQTPM